MKLDDIQQEWSKDCLINNADLGHESLNISKLHHKYHQIFTHERVLLHKYESELRELRLQKYEFYTQGPTQETQQKGWKLPAVGKVLRNDVNNYIDADADVIKQTLKIAVQQEKINLLDSILRNINGRSFQIRNAIEWIKFSNGIN